jgi:hypothetical protein
MSNLQQLQAKLDDSETRLFHVDSESVFRMDVRLMQASIKS